MKWLKLVSARHGESEMGRLPNRPKWWAWIVLIVLLVVVMAVYELLDRRVRGQKEDLYNRVGPLAVGMTAEEIQRGRLKPDLVCSHDKKVVLWDDKRSEEVEIWTAMTWVYRIRKIEMNQMASSNCGAAYEDTEIGFDESGRVIWFTRNAGESGTVIDESL